MLYSRYDGTTALQPQGYSLQETLTFYIQNENDKEISRIKQNKSIEIPEGLTEQIVFYGHKHKILM